MSAPALQLSEVATLAKKARDRVASETETRNWADLWPVAVPFLERGTRNDIKDAVQFLIEEGHVDETQRSAAEQGFRRERSRRNQVTVDSLKN